VKSGRIYTAAMAVAEFTTPLDLEKIRADFPILARPVHGKRLVFLDSAASSQKPRQVIETLVDVYETSYANVHRGVYYLGARATERYEGARDIMAGFVNAGDRREVIFVREATEALNLVAYAYGRTFVGPGDAIVATEMEHHSNLVPWQFLAQQTGATLHYLRLTDDGSLDPDSQERLAAIDDNHDTLLWALHRLGPHEQLRLVNRLAVVWSICGRSSEGSAITSQFIVLSVLTTRAVGNSRWMRSARLSSPTGSSCGGKPLFGFIGLDTSISTLPARLSAPARRSTSSVTAPPVALSTTSPCAAASAKVPVPARSGWVASQAAAFSFAASRDPITTS